MNIVAVIQARLGSTRLPGKVLFDLEGKPALEHIIERVKASKLINEVIVATTVKKHDLEIVKICANLGTVVYCGSERDVLDRYYQAGLLLRADHIVRITADCPVIDYVVIDKVVQLHLAENADYTSNTLKDAFPDGQDVEVIAFTALKKAWKEAVLDSEREHVTPYFKKNPDLFNIRNLEFDKDYSQKRWTLDEADDYRFIQIIYKNLYCRNRLFGMDEIINFLNEHPEYEKINNYIVRNAGYLKSVKEDNVLKARE